MYQNASENYLVTEVMTAPPQKLHSMLLEAAFRAAENGRRLWRDNEKEQGGKSILRAQKIVREILCTFNYEEQSDLLNKTAAVYLFICNALTRAYLDNDENKLDEALRILSIECETWRMLCEQLVGTSETDTYQPSHAPLAPIMSSDGMTTDPSLGSFSLEA